MGHLTRYLVGRLKSVMLKTSYIVILAVGFLGLAFKHLFNVDTPPNFLKVGTPLGCILGFLNHIQIQLS